MESSGFFSDCYMDIHKSVPEKEYYTQYLCSWAWRIKMQSRNITLMGLAQIQNTIYT